MTEYNQNIYFENIKYHIDIHQLYLEAIKKQQPGSGYIQQADNIDDLTY